MRRTGCICPLIPVVVVVLLGTLGVVTPAARALQISASAPIATPGQPVKYETFRVTGNIGTSGARTVVLQRFSAGKAAWEHYRTTTSTTAGGYAFTARTALRKRLYRVKAPPTPEHPEAVVSETLTVTTVAQGASLSMMRTAAAEATVTGTFTPVRPGRLAALQRRDATGWTQLGTRVPQDADGRVEISLGLGGLSRWNYRSYRLVAESHHGAPSAKSAITRFMPGPTTLGSHVIRVNTTGNVYPAAKGTTYTGTLTLDGGEPMDMEAFGVRGTSTSKYSKKPYKIKFAGGQTPYGWPKGKRFNLLALFVDNTLVRDKLSLDLARSLTNMAWSSHTQYTELFVNDLYMGVYLFTEATKIGAGRIDIDKARGAILEADGVKIEADHVEFVTPHGNNVKFEDPDEYKTLEDGSPDPEGVTDEKLAAVEYRIGELEAALYSEKGEGYLERVGAHLDIPSTIDFYLVKEFTKDVDSDFFRSCDFYLPDYTDPASRFHFGPAWDFDRSAGADTRQGNEHVASPEGWYVRGLMPGPVLYHPNHATQWFAQLGQDATFMELVRARWAEVKPRFLAVGMTEAQAAADLLRPDIPGFHASAASDRSRWASETKPFGWHSTFYQGEVDYVKDWYLDRYEWMDQHFPE